jgi:LSD1 subclass zinc finger protein
MRTLARLLERRAAIESGEGTWLNLGCGSCRELLSLPDDSVARTIRCVDTDREALAFAQRLLAGKRIGTLDFLAENALRFCRAERNVGRFGPFSTIYSAGLFDYLSSDALSKLIGALWQSLRKEGLLIAPFKDAQRYDTFDYHWLSKWHFFFQREEGQYRQILANAGIPESAVRVQRDDSGLILFFLIAKSAQDEIGRRAQDEEPDEIEPRAAEPKSGGKTWGADAPGDRKHIHG